MVFGQSGGGAKTCALLAMPSAVGLLHRERHPERLRGRAGAPRERQPQRQAPARPARARPKRVAELRDVPFRSDRGPGGDGGRGHPDDVRPVVGGDVLPQHPFTPAGPEISRDIPLIVSTTLDEATVATDIDLDEDGLRAQITEAVYDAAAAGPRGVPGGLSRRGAVPGHGPRPHRPGQFRSSNTLAERKAAQGGGAVYKYLFTWPSPAFDGRFAAVHGVDVARVPPVLLDDVGGGVPQAKALAGELASAWVNFARTGDPNGAGVTAWPAYTPALRSTRRPRRHQRGRRPAARHRLLWDDLA
jgi:para-nitrobenzyl esterase